MTETTPIALYRLDKALERAYLGETLEPELREAVWRCHALLVEQGIRRKWTVRSEPGEAA